MKAIESDYKNAVFSFIPNTAETSFLGLVEGMNTLLNEQKAKKLVKLGNTITQKEIEAILNQQIRVEKVAIKDAKLRTFITQDDGRDDLVAHVYDITYGSIVPKKDALVMIDDSIVRGTTLEKSIIRMLDRLDPKQIVIVSSAPQIRYPDCYGIDMARMGDFIAFRAAVELHKERGNEKILKKVYKKAKEQLALPMDEQINVVKEIYAAFKMEEISDKVAQLVTPPDCKAEVKVIFQSIEGLHIACPNHSGDWYFSGDYPTPGGSRVVNKSYQYYFEGNNERAY
jgi:amidophosphoribosyltransferase